MNEKVKMITIGILLIILSMQDSIGQSISFESSTLHPSVVNWEGKTLPAKTTEASTLSVDSDSDLLAEPVKIGWKLLIDIEYKLKYFKDIGMEIYTPVFSEAVKAMDGKEVIIKGYVIPVDEKGDLIVLSANPNSSCFFCGKASPASVMSVYVRDKDKRYEMDAVKEFRGVLSLNYDNPEEFYYILNNAH